MPGLIYESTGLGEGCRFKIDDYALSKLRAFAQHQRHALEAGGVLLGRWLTTGLGFVVDDVTTPLPGDRRTRTSFFRSGPTHMQAIEASLKNSRYTRGYLGEWHTHAEPVPRPSPVDLHDWRRRMRQDSVESPRVFFVIVGTTEIAVWAGDRTRHCLTPLELLTLGRSLGP
jgi:integrative and conjugative element protein (TIGR02256 family)